MKKIVINVLLIVSAILGVCAFVLWPTEDPVLPEHYTIQCDGNGHWRWVYRFEYPCAMWGQGRDDEGNLIPLYEKSTCVTDATMPYDKIIRSHGATRRDAILDAIQDNRRRIGEWTEECQ